MAPKQFTRKQLEHRNHKDDAVIVIDNRVYDVTKFLEDHPGGHEVLLDNAGKDASECFHDIGHSQDAREWMKQFEIGEVVEGERREVRGRPTFEVAEEEPTSIITLLNVWLPPLAMAVGAYLLYTFLFA